MSWQLILGLVIGFVLAELFKRFVLPIFFDWLDRWIDKAWRP